MLDCFSVWVHGCNNPSVKSFSVCVHIIILPFLLRVSANNFFAPCEWIIILHYAFPSPCDWKRGKVSGLQPYSKAKTFIFTRKGANSNWVPDLRFIRNTVPGQTEMVRFAMAHLLISVIRHSFR